MKEMVCRWCKKDLTSTDYGIKGDYTCPYCKWATPPIEEREPKTDITIPTGRTVPSSLTKGYARLRYTPRDPIPPETPTTY